MHVAQTLINATYLTISSTADDCIAICVGKEAGLEDVVVMAAAVRQDLGACNINLHGPMPPENHLLTRRP